MPSLAPANAHPRRAAWLLAVLLPALSLGIGLATWKFRDVRKREFLDRAAADLRTLADMKAQALAEGFRDHLRDAAVVSRNPFLLRHVAEYLRTGRDAGSVAEWLRELRDTGDYQTAALAGPDGRVHLITATPAIDRVSPHLLSIWRTALAGDQPYLTAPHRYRAGGAVHHDIVAPLRADGRVVGALVFRLDTGAAPWLSPCPAGARRVRAALSWREGDTGARRQPGGVDAAGTPVIAIESPVGSTGLTLLVEQAQSEILEPLAGEVRAFCISISLAVGCLFLIAGVAVHRRREMVVRDLVESIPGGVWLCDPSGATIYRSPQLARLLSLPPGGSLWDMIHPAERADAEALFHRALQRREPVEFVFRLAPSAPVERILLARAAPRYSSGAEFLGYIGNVIDVTSRERAEERVRQLSRAVEQSPALVVITDTEGVIQYVNPRFTEVTGYTAEEAVGRAASLLQSGTTQRETYDKLWQTIRDGREWRGELLNRKKCGETFWVSMTVSGIRDSAGVLTHFVAAQEDITAWKRAQTDLQRSAAQIRRMVDCNLIGTMVIQGELVVEANDEFLRATGFSRQDLRAGLINWRKLTPPEHLELSERAHNELARTGLVHPFEKEYFRKDGSRLPVLIGGTILELAPRREVCFMLDLTAIKRSEQEIQRMNGELRRLSAELLRSEDVERRRIARELHDSTAQILTGIQLNLKRLERSIGAEDPLRAVLDQTGEMARQCTTEIRAISYAMHPPLLDDLGLAAAIDMLARGFQERTGIEVSLELPRDLPRFDADLELALFRIVQEALANVHRHSSSRWAAVRLRRSPDGLLLEVEDRGPRLQAAEPSRVGVGLLGMRERAKQFGGEMALVTGAAGATVRVRMPAR